MTEIPQAAQDAAIGNALAILTTEVWTLIALLLVGCGVGMAFVGLCRMWMIDQTGLPPDLLRARDLRLKRLGAASSGLWTVAIQFWYATHVLSLNAVAGIVVALGAGVLAAAANHPLFGVVYRVWKWALRKLPS